MAHLTITRDRHLCVFMSFCILYFLYDNLIRAICVFMAPNCLCFVMRSLMGHEGSYLPSFRKKKSDATEQGISGHFYGT